jgi:DNA (cytosine-5)-methyltransferase 1
MVSGGGGSVKRCLDLFCGAGGGAMGYHRAGFEVTGIDIKPQPRFPFSFVQADALEFLGMANLARFSLIHASPPCQAYSRARVLHGREHPDLVPAVRAALERTGKPYVIENVPGAPLIHPVLLCGLHFGLKVFRHRLFETDGWLLSMPHVPHGDRRIGRDGFCCPAGHGESGRVRVPADHRCMQCWRAAMGIDWMTRAELAQAIPPAYTQWIGEQLS